MKLCVTSSGQSLDDAIDPRFGRCQYFIIVDTENLQFDTIQNPAISAGGGAGIQAGQLVANKGAEVVLTGNVGPNAFNTLQAAGLKIVVGLSGITVRQTIEGFKSGKYQYIGDPSVEAHYGTSGGGSNPQGGMGTGMASPQPTQQLSKDEELKMLSEQSQKMKKDLEMIHERIDDLMKKK